MPSRPTPKPAATAPRAAFMAGQGPSTGPAGAATPAENNHTKNPKNCIYSATPLA